MKKVLLVLMPLVAALLLLALWPSPKPAPWQTNARLEFLHFTNAAPGSPQIDAFFGFRGPNMSPYSWELLELSQQQNGRWKRNPLPLPRRRLYYGTNAPHGFLMAISVPVPQTNTPLRIVMEIGENGPVAVLANAPPRSEWGKFVARWRYRYKKFVHPHNPARWIPPVPVKRLTNEFNFPTN